MPTKCSLTIAATIVVFGFVVSGSRGDDLDTSNPSRAVDPFISTGGNRFLCGHNSPGATTPFGLVRLSPDTISRGGITAANKSGYFYHDPLILGFSHTRLCGTGAVDGGHFRVMLGTNDTPLEVRRRGMRTKFDHKTESASPGYYSVALPKLNLKAELTATQRVGLHRYRFDAGAVPKILIDVGSALGNGQSEACEVHVFPDRAEVTGTARTRGTFSSRYGGLQVYFVARFRKPWKSFATWSDNRVVDSRAVATGEDVGVDFTFASTEQEQTIELAVALSHVSIENARENLEAELSDRSFDDVRTAAEAEWNALLSTARIEGGSASDQRIFYTALYHSLNMPTIFNDVNGQYLGFDQQVHQAEGFQYYTDMSLWDTFRTTHPLFTLLTPDRHRDMIVSLVKMAEQGGSLPRWPAGAGYSGSMFGAPAEIVIAEAYLKGIRNFDVETAYRVMRKAALQPAPSKSSFATRPDIAEFVKYGYCPSDTMTRAVSKTLEYASTDAAIGRLAAALGHDDDAALFAKRAQFYRNVWNPETQYFQARDAAGQFSTPLKPLLLTYFDFSHKYTDDYVEGSALQWRWAVSHDAAGLVSLFSSPEYFVEELEKFFAGSFPRIGMTPNGYYWQGNQPDIHAAYLFNAAGRPDLTQKWVRWILKHKHDDGPIGLDGNDDGGTLSAWYVFSSLGFYPVVGTDRYELGSPLWKRAIVKIGSQRLEIVADNYAPDRVYVERVELNGKPLDRWWFTHDEISQGGTLRFIMSDEPSQP
ncbi:MAG: glycoside hydrolase family 92 protein [Planctomycetes bacterium]|nr:glycoside hydrolase family 92 protein [Planctomycetota bacterium]